MIYAEEKIRSLFAEVNQDKYVKLSVEQKMKELEGINA